MFAINEVDDVNVGDKLIEKYGKLLKTRKTSKGQKLFKSENSKGKKSSKSRKLAKSRKKLSKSENSPNFNPKNNGPSFLTSKARAAFNCLRLAFIEALIFQHFDLECHIWIETDISSYAINGMLSQLTSINRPDRVVTKTNLGQ